MEENNIKLPFSNAQEFVGWAREALARKKRVTDKVQQDWDEYMEKRQHSSLTI